MDRTWNEGCSVYSCSCTRPWSGSYIAMLSNIPPVLLPSPSLRAGWGIPVRYLCVILLPLMTNILDYVVAAPYLHPEPLAMAMYTTGPGWLHGTTGSRFLNLENWIKCLNSFSTFLTALAMFNQLQHSKVSKIFSASHGSHVTSAVSMAPFRIDYLRFVFPGVRHLFVVAHQTLLRSHWRKAASQLQFRYTNW